MIKNIAYLTGLLLISLACSSKSETIDNPDPIVDPPTPTDSIPSGYMFNYAPGSILYGDNNYVQFKVGDSNTQIIITAGHGGSLRPSTIPDRTQGETVQDLNTMDLAYRMADSIKNRIGARPHIIVNNLHRIKLDPNRDTTEIFLTHPSARVAYDQYHEYIYIARKMITERKGKGLLLDVHGHAHEIDRTELGYLNVKSQLNGTDAHLENYANRSSIYNLFQNSDYTFAQLIRGDKSFGTLMVEEGLAAVPSKTDPKPNDDAYFTGGYTSLAHGSRDSGTISAIQLEFPRPSVRNTETTRANAASKLANVVKQYLIEHYNY